MATVLKNNMGFNIPVKPVIVFSSLFGVVEHRSRWKGDLPPAKSYVLGTFAYSLWNDQWYQRGHSYKTLQHVPEWHEVRKRNVPKEHLLMALVYL